MRAPQDAVRPRRRRRMSRRGRVVLAVVLAALFILFLSLRGIASFYTDFLWFDSLNLSSVWSGLLAARVMLGLIFTGAFFALLWVNLLVADRLAPRFRPSGPEEELLERYYEMVGRRTGAVRVGVSLLFAIIAGAGVSQQWNNWLLFTNGGKFGETDAQFGTDIGFYIFKLPFLTFLVSWLFAAFVIILIITTVAHYLNGGIRLQTPIQRVTPQVKAHLSVLLAALALVKAAGYWLQRFELTGSSRGFVGGAGYTDIKAQLPAIMLLLWISVFSCVLFFVNIRRRGWVLPVLAVGLWAFVAAIAGSAYPWFVQRFQVEPAESSRERPYIARNIAATRKAYGIDNVATKPFEANETLAQADLTTDKARQSVSNLRLLDPEIVGDTFQKREADLGWLQFNAQLDVDRYLVDGKLTPVVIGARELNAQNLPQKSWESQRLIYTHGYGVALAPANEVTNQEPTFLVQGLPLVTSPRVNIKLDDDKARLYYSENLPGFAVVDTKRAEIGYKQEDDAYTGSSGVGMGSYLRRLAFALRFQDLNPLISTQIDDNSRILFVRNVRERAEKVAPFLRFDADPYPVVVDGEVQYVIDAYTTSDRYPYSQRSSVGAGSGLDGSFNYVRNSVKAVVNAYTGSVDLYLVPGADGAIDPIAAAYQKAFPKLFKPLSAMPKSMAEHLRHPEDLFKVQTSVYARYHVDQPDVFYSGNGRWAVAQGPRRDVTADQASNRQVNPATGQVTTSPEDRVRPQYVLMTLPGEEQEEYVQVRTFVPASEDDQKKELTGFMAARTDGSLISYEVQADNVPGPALVVSSVLSNQQISRDVTLLGQKGSSVEFGNLLLLPVNQSLLWVLPVYVSATGPTQVPKLTEVIVVYGQRLARATTVQQALAKLFDDNPADDDTLTGPTTGSSVPTTTTPTSQPQAGGTPGTTVPTPSTQPPTGGAPVKVEDLARQAQQKLAEADAALKNGQLGLYQQRVDEARELVRRIAEQVTPTTEKQGGDA